MNPLPPSSSSSYNAAAAAAATTAAASNNNNNNKRPRSRSGGSSVGNNNSRHPHTAPPPNVTHHSTDPETNNNNNNQGSSSHQSDSVKSTRATTLPTTTSRERIIPQMIEDYVELASHMMLFPLSQIRAANLMAASGGPTTNAANHGKTNGVRPNDGNHSTFTTGSTTTTATAAVMTTTPQSQYLVHISALGYLKSPRRRPTVIEQWSPYEIAMFEASIAEHGKNFARIQQDIRTSKTVAEVIEFYYIWKKTSHYAQWKKEYVPEYLDVDDDVDEYEP